MNCNVSKCLFALLKRICFPLAALSNHSSPRISFPTSFCLSFFLLLFLSCHIFSLSSLLFLSRFSSLYYPFLNSSISARICRISLLSSSNIIVRLLSIQLSYNLFFFALFHSRRTDAASVKYQYHAFFNCIKAINKYSNKMRTRCTQRIAESQIWMGCFMFF